MMIFCKRLSIQMLRTLLVLSSCTVISTSAIATSAISSSAIATSAASTTSFEPEVSATTASNAAATTAFESSTSAPTSDFNDNPTSTQKNIILAAQNTKKASKGKTKSDRFGDRRDVQIWIWDMHVKHNFSAQDLKTLFRTISPEPKVIQAISKPFEEVTWNKYRERFVNDVRAREGVQFWKENAETLKKAEEKYGVPAEVIVAIIGVETNYGKNKGNFLVLQALATLAFDYPPRAAFFKKELEQFLLLTRDEKLDPKNIYGSYAGAMGTPQFIPSSYREYAVDFTGHGKRDLINNTSDAIGSVANYFKMHGWQAGEPVAYMAQGYGSEYERLATTNQKDPKPKISLGEFAQFNIVPKDKTALKNKDRLAAFLILKTDDKPEHWLALQNFYVITRYNHSVNYAMAVHQLSKRIRELRES